MELAASSAANANDDLDIGAGGLTDFPVLTSARRDAKTGVTEMVVTLNGKPSTQYRIELFRVVGDPSGHGEGQTRIATHTTTTDSGGDKTFRFLLTGWPSGSC